MFLCPLSESAQRLSSILLTFRDRLGLSIDLFLVPNEIKSEKNIPLRSYYRFLADSNEASAVFSNLPLQHVLTLRIDVPEPWDVQQVLAEQDTDNLRCEKSQNCNNIVNVLYALKGLLIFGECFEKGNGEAVNGLQLNSFREGSGMILSDTIVMKTMGYFQLKANVGLWDLAIASDSRGSKIFNIASDDETDDVGVVASKKIIVKDFLSTYQKIHVSRKQEMSEMELLSDDDIDSNDNDRHKLQAEDDVIHVFSLATGHLYERLLRIMMLSVSKRTSVRVKFWLLENFLSPSFKASALKMAKNVGFEVEFITYKWPEWLRLQDEKQRIIWGYKILFLDVLFPLNLRKIIFVDADQVMRADLKELWDLDIHGAPYAYTPFCDSRHETVGFQFWREGYWRDLLNGRPYHISALYVVDLVEFRRQAVGDKLRAIYQQLSADPASLANLDQDLPNYAQRIGVEIFSLPQEWLWCETWCSDETKTKAKTIDLCNNPLYKESKLNMAKRIISGDLFEESWDDLDKEVNILLEA